MQIITGTAPITSYNVHIQIHTSRVYHNAVDTTADFSDPKQKCIVSETMPSVPVWQLYNPG